MLIESEEAESPELMHAKELRRRSTFGTAMFNAFEENSQHNDKTSRTSEQLRQQKKENEEEADRYLDSLLLENQESMPENTKQAQQ